MRHRCGRQSGIKCIRTRRGRGRQEPGTRGEESQNKTGSQDMKQRREEVKYWTDGETRDFIIRINPNAATCGF